MTRIYETVLFDLDGTLTDSKAGIINSIQYALQYFDIVVEDRDSLTKFIGPPLRESFQEFYGFDEKKVALALSKYREYFDKQGIYENAVYPFIPELLEELVNEGMKLILATSKPIPFAQRILDYFDLTKYFTFAAGSNLDGSRIVKSEVIAYALEQCGLVVNKHIVMVGDRKHDIIGAKTVGIASIGVLYGFGTRRELEAENPTHIVTEVSDLRAVLL